MSEISDLAKLIGGLETDLEESTNLVDDEEVTTDEEEVEENLEEAEESEESGAEVEEEEQGDEESPEETTEPETDEEDESYYPETLDDLIAAYDGDGDKLKGVVVASKKNGDKVTLDQVLSNWEIGESAVRKSQEASELRKQLDTERNTFQAAMVGKLEEQENIITALEDLYKQTGKAELETLRTEDPAEYAARRAEHNDRDSLLDKIKGKIRSDKEEAMAGEQEKNGKLYQEYVASEGAAMYELIPEWKDSKVFNEEFVQISEYMKGMGYADDDLGKIVDAKSRKVIRDAMLYNRIKTKASPKKKRAVKKPKRAVRAGNANKANAKSEAFKKQMKSAAKSRNNGVKTQAVADLLSNL